MNNTTPKEFLSNKLKIELDIDHIKTFKSKQVTIHYVPVRCNGKPLNIECHNQILASNAKVPNKTDDVKFLNLSFRSMEEDSIPYNNAEKLVKQNREFIKMLDVIDEQYKELVNDLELPNIRMPSNAKIGSIKQDTRQGTNEEVKLEEPIYRARLPVTASGLVGTCYDQYKPIVTDGKKNTLLSLTIDQAKQFLTYQSLASFILHIECVVVSKTGLSLRATIKKISVLHKKPVVIELNTDFDEFASDSDGEFDLPSTMKEKITKSNLKTKSRRSRVPVSSDESD